MKRAYDGKMMKRKNMFVQRQEGVEAVDRAIQYLHSVTTTGENFRLSKGLSQAAKELCEISYDKVGQFVDESLIRKHGNFYGQMEQYLAFMNNSPREIVLEWILDDGNQNGEHRQMLFSNEFKFVGIASGPHKDHQRITCVILVTEFEEPNDETKQIPQQQVTTPQQQSNPNIGDLEVEGLTTLHDENVTLLTINNVGCDLNQLSLEVHNDGNELYIKRSVIIDHIHHDLKTKIRLPDKVTQNSTSATYNRNEKNGELVFRMGQVISDFVGTYDICDFTVEGEDNSETPEDLEFDISQTNESFIFVPRAKAKSSCRVSALLENNSLKFIVTHGDVTKIRTIKIPVPISPVQVILEDHTVGKKITINKKPNITELQPDFKVTISPV